jgi:hypothetical protein
MKFSFLAFLMLTACQPFIPGVTNPQCFGCSRQDKVSDTSSYEKDTGTYQTIPVRISSFDTSNPNGGPPKDSDTSEPIEDSNPTDSSTPPSEDTGYSIEEFPVEDTSSSFDLICPLQNPYWDTAELMGNGSGYCVILNDNSLYCKSWYSITSISGDFLTIDTGFNHEGMCGVKTNYKATCSPLTTSSPANYGQFNPPNDDFCDITISDSFACGILTDGSITCWGRGDTEESNGYHGYGGSVPSGNDWVKIQASGYDAVCAMDIDGYVYCWGSIFSSSSLYATPSNPAIDFDVFNYYGVILQRDGSYEEWGYEGSDSHTSVNLPYEGRRISIISNGVEIICPIYIDGSSPECNNYTTSSSLFNQTDAYLDAVVYKDPWISIMEDGSMTFEASSIFSNWTDTLGPGSVKTVPFPE